MSEPIRSISRRRFGLALSLSGLAGCGFGPLDPQIMLDRRAGRVRILTPWGDDLRRRFETAFATWATKSGSELAEIRWIAVSDADLSAAAFENALKFADAVLGGHRFLHERRPLTGVSRASFVPIRFPVIRTVAAAPAVSAEGQEPNSADVASSDRGTISTALPFDLGDDADAPVVSAYFRAIFEDAPDPAAGYARWIRTVGTSVPGSIRTNRPHRELRLSDAAPAGRSPETLWTGGPGMLRSLGLEESAQVHWPECMSWNEAAAAGPGLGQLIRFCSSENWFDKKSPIRNAADVPNGLQTMLARIVRSDCRTEIVEAWGEVQAATDERRKEAETYLTTAPPWPPASVQALRKERGFEFVVALAGQLATDRTQQERLVDEFGKPQETLDLRLLETSLPSDSPRFQAWLHAEWAAWIRQRCRRTVRYLRSAEAASVSNSDFHRTGGSSVI